MASKISKYAAVRLSWLHFREGSAKKMMLSWMEEIGTTVLPDAFCKIYLTASSDARAKI